MADNDLIINGFKFQTKKEYEAAKKEYESIQYIKAKTDLSNVSIVLKLYNKLIDKKTFSTIIGYTFLKELQKIIVLENTPPNDYFPIFVNKAESATINTSALKGNEIVNGIQVSEFKKYKELVEIYKQRNKSIKIVCAFLIIIILAMFIVTANADYSPLQNYKKEILEEYAAWKEELTEKENLLNEREKELESKINSQSPPSTTP